MKPVRRIDHHSDLRQFLIGIASERLSTSLRNPYRHRPESTTAFVRNHAKGVVACDFFVVVTATFRVLYVFVVMELGTRSIVHCNVTAHPTADWTLQQFREALAGD